MYLCFLQNIQKEYSIASCKNCCDFFYLSFYTILKVNGLDVSNNLFIIKKSNNWINFKIKQQVDILSNPISDIQLLVLMHFALLLAYELVFCIILSSFIQITDPNQYN